MKFGKTIQLQSRLAWNLKWTDYYLAYRPLKKLINMLATADISTIRQALQGSKKTVPHLGCLDHSGASDGAPDAVAQPSSVGVSDNDGGLLRFNYFKRSLAYELRKIDNFVSLRVKHLEKLSGTFEDASSEELSRGVRDIRQLQEFVELNYTGVLKICKKFDKKVANQFTDHPKILPVYQDKVDRKRLAYVDKLNTLLGTAVELARTFAESEIAQGAENSDDCVLKHDYPVVSDLVLETFPAETISRVKLAMPDDAMGDPILVPVIVVRGKSDGPVMGITSALHGNELNGIPVLHNLIRQICLESLHGTLVAIPVLNPPGYLRKQRYFHDGQDLNRLFPGNKLGNCGQVFAKCILDKIVCKFDYHIDLHTASFGRVNSFYVRADMNHPTSHPMAIQTCSQIIVHNTAPDGSLRAAAMSEGIPSITLEIGNPQVFHKKFVEDALTGIENILLWLKMIEKHPEADLEYQPVFTQKPTVCTRSFWIYSSLAGGLLQVLPEVNTWVAKGEVYAQVRNVYGDVVATYMSPCDAIVVGKSTNPVCNAGDRLIHLGVVGDEFPEVVDDGHT